jgi:hypothetical protein
MVQKSQGYWGKIDLHTVNCFGENTAQIEPTRGVSPIMLGMLGKLGIKNIVAFAHGLPEVVPNAIVLEALASGLARDHETLRCAFRGLANDPEPITLSASDFNWFSHSGSLHIDNVTPDVIAQNQRDTLRAFEVLPPDITDRLGTIGTPTCLCSWRFEPNQNGYWGELVTPIPVPDDSSWLQIE